MRFSLAKVARFIVWSFPQGPDSSSTWINRRGQRHEPYFYVSVYPKPDPAMLPTLPMFGHWHTYEFMAAVSTAHKILSATNEKTETDEFLQCAVDVALKLLS
jgi:hypothetical protein